MTEELHTNNNTESYQNKVYNEIREEIKDVRSKKPEFYGLRDDQNDEFKKA